MAERNTRKGCNFLVHISLAATQNPYMLVKTEVKKRSDFQMRLFCHTTISTPIMLITDGFVNWTLLTKNSNAATLFCHEYKHKNTHLHFFQKWKHHGLLDSDEIQTGCRFNCT